MSQANVDTARGALKAVSAGDYADAERCFRGDVEWHNTAAFPGPRVIVGPKAIVDFCQELLWSFDADVKRGTIEKIAAGGDRVVMGMHSRGSGKASGVPVDVMWAISFRMREGQVERVDISGNYADAVHAAGLAE